MRPLKNWAAGASLVFTGLPNAGTSLCIEHTEYSDDHAVGKVEDGKGESLN
jgi:hypothetical protein